MTIRTLLKYQIALSSCKKAGVPVAQDAHRNNSLPNTKKAGNNFYAHIMSSISPVMEP
jgi:hypothetical protein